MTNSDTGGVVRDALDALLVHIRNAHGINSISSASGSVIVNTWRAGSGYTHLSPDCARINAAVQMTGRRIDNIIHLNPCADCATLPGVAANFVTHRMRLDNAVAKLRKLANHPLLWCDT